MTVQSLLNRPIVSPANLLHTVEIEKQLYLQTFAAFKDSFGTLVVYWIWLSHKKSPLLSCLQCINVKWFRSPKRERQGENLPKENKRKALEMEGATVRLQFWMHRRPGEKGEQWSFRTCPSLRVALFVASSFCSQYRGRDRWSKSLAIALIDGRPIQHLYRPLSRAKRALRTNVSTLTLLPLFVLHSISRFPVTLYLRIHHSSSTFAPLSKKKKKKGLPYFPLMWQ